MALLQVIRTHGLTVDDSCRLLKCKGNRITWSLDSSSSGEGR